MIQSSEVVKKMSDFDAANATNPLFTVFRQYMCMVMELFAFIQAVHSGDWKLPLIALELFTKYFFVHDKICYLRMIPLYLAEVASLESSDPEIYGEFTTGNWVVNKNKEVPFCAVGGDTALEHLNRSMKVSGGLEGNTLNESAQAKFFLIAPELARLTTEAKAMAGLVPERAHHRELNSAVLTDEDNSLNKLTETIKTFTNPFSSDQNTNTDLYNLVTKVVMNEKTKKDLVNQSEEVEWNSWFVGCFNQRQTSKLSKPSDGPSLRKIIINIRGQIENRPLQNTRSADRKRLTAGC